MNGLACNIVGNLLAKDLFLSCTPVKIYFALLKTEAFRTIRGGAHFRRCNGISELYTCMFSLQVNCSVALSCYIIMFKVVKFACRLFKYDDCCVIKKKNEVYKV